MSTAKFSLAVLLPLLGAVGCAAPASDGTASDQGALEVGASMLSGLEPGSYASSSGLLRIEQKEQGRLYATLYTVKSAVLLTPIIMGRIDVSVLDGTVTLGEPSACKVKFAASKGRVRLAASADDVCFGEPFDQTFVQRTPKDLEGVYACASYLPYSQGDTGMMTLSAANTQSIRADFTASSGVVRSQRIDAKFSLPATDFGSTSNGADTSFFLTSPSGFEWWTDQGPHMSCKKQ